LDLPPEKKIGMTGDLESPKETPTNDRKEITTISYQDNGRPKEVKFKREEKEAMIANGTHTIDTKINSNMPKKPSVHEQNLLEEEKPCENEKNQLSIIGKGQSVGSADEIHEQPPTSNNNNNDSKVLEGSGIVESPPSPLPHRFVEAHFNTPTFCQKCNGFIWGIGKQGYQCEKCHCAIHKRCLSGMPNSGCGDRLKEPTDQQLKAVAIQKKAFAEEIENSSFGMFTPSNPIEEDEFSKQLEAKILKDIKKKHARDMPPKIFNLDDIIPVIKDGMSVIVSDEFTNCFLSSNPRPWNWNPYLYVGWILGILIRYGILFPLRAFCLLIGSLAVAIAFCISWWFFKDPVRRTQIQLKFIQLYCVVFIASFSGVIRYHGPRPQKRPRQIFVANHTTVFDIVFLQQHMPLSIVGQKHVAVIGFFQKYVLSCLGCLWFDRKDSEDRAKISQQIKEHVYDDNKLPLLLFPEGTCVNNEYCVMFKKGAFEIEGATIYPVAIKYK